MGWSESWSLKLYIYQIGNHLFNLFSYICYMKEHILYFKELLGDYCLTDSESLDKYSHDETEDIKQFPSCVLKPRQVEEVSKILSYRSEERRVGKECRVQW